MNVSEPSCAAAGPAAAPTPETDEQYAFPKAFAAGTIYVRTNWRKIGAVSPSFFSS